MNYLVAVLSDRIQAEDAYTALEKAGIPTKQISILGKGYKSADEFGLIKPEDEGRKNAIRMAYWLVPFGFLVAILLMPLPVLIPLVGLVNLLTIL